MRTINLTFHEAWAAAKDRPGYHKPDWVRAQRHHEREEWPLDDWPLIVRAAAAAGARDPRDASRPVAINCECGAKIVYHDDGSAACTRCGSPWSSKPAPFSLDKPAIYISADKPEPTAHRTHQDVVDALRGRIVREAEAEHDPYSAELAGLAALVTAYNGTVWADDPEVRENEIGDRGGEGPGPSDRPGWKVTS